VTWGKVCHRPVPQLLHLYNGERKPRSPVLKSLREAVTIGHALLGSTHKCEFLLHSYPSVILHPLFFSEAIEQGSPPTCRVSVSLQTWIQLASVFSCPSVSSVAILALGQVGGLLNLLVVCFLQQTVSSLGVGGREMSVPVSQRLAGTGATLHKCGTGLIVSFRLLLRCHLR